MARYRANVSFGPWTAGEVFESDDPLHEKYANPEAGLLTRLGASILRAGRAGSPPPASYRPLVDGES